nr:DUF624 domain-containing protein [Evansella caseinilytica]
MLLNLLWLLFTVGGLVLFGIFPATAALFSVLRHMLTKDEDVAVIPLFGKKFKEEFLMANALGYISSLGALILFINLRILQQFEPSTIRSILFGATVVIAIIYGFIFMYLYPLFVHMKVKLVDYIKLAFFMAIAKPLHTVLNVSGMACIWMIYGWLPVLIFVFGISLPALVLMRVALISLPKQEHTQ